MCNLNVKDQALNKLSIHGYSFSWLAIWFKVKHTFWFYVYICPYVWVEKEWINEA